MPRAAPGDNASGAGRRKLPEYLVVPGDYSDRHTIKYPYRSGMERDLYSQKNGSTQFGTFTQLLSVYGVERGRLGKVVSLVGDCRPPPPGNPHRPTTSRGELDGIGGRHQKLVPEARGNLYFASSMHIAGGLIFPIWLPFSFNKHKKLRNLKILNSSEYFKENRSYFYCTEKKPVLEFGSFPIPPVRVEGMGTPSYSDNKCSRNAGIIYALPLL
jgi:hypothetical protein